MSSLPPARPPARPLPRRTSRLQSRRTSLAGYFSGEDRQQFLVNALFIGLIALLVLILSGAVALNWYEQNVRPLAHVGAVEISPGSGRSYIAYRSEVINRELSHIRPAAIDGDIDAATAQQMSDDLRQEQSELATTGLESLIDAIYQSQLAAERGIAVSDADVDAELARLLAAPARRHVLAIFVEPVHEGEDTSPTTAERNAALARAEQARAELDAGHDWADVAREYSTDASAASGGDYGEVSPIGGVDPAWIDALFELPEGGTTYIVRGSDGVYRIGRVVSILPAAEEPGARNSLFKAAPESQVREFLAYEIADRQLRQQVIAESLTGTPEQIHVSAIYVEGLFSGDEETVDEGEISYREIVFALNHDMTTDPIPPDDDPAWAEAKSRADEAFATLSAIEDLEERATKFAELATSASDNESSGADGGAQDFTTRGLLPDAVGEALFGGTHEHNELIGPVKADVGYWLLLFDERRESPEQKVAEVEARLKEPDADFAALAMEYSDSPEAADGGEIGWLTREMLSEEIVDQLFDLQTNEVSEPIELGGGHYFFKVDEHRERPLDANEIAVLRVTAFDNWYAPLKAEAEANRVIERTGEENPNPTDFEDV